MRKIEWVGLPSVFADPRVKYLQITGRMTPKLLEFYRQAASRRIYRVPGATIRILEKNDPPGLSRSYQWGKEPGSYIQNVTEADWRIIQESQSRQEFRDVTNGPTEEVILKPQDDIQVIREEKFSDFKSFLRAMQTDTR